MTGELTPRSRRQLRLDGRAAGLATAEIVVALACSTGVVALMRHAVSPSRLAIVYLPAVLYVAIRRGERPALVAALLSVLTLNFLFIAPVHRLTIAHSQDVVALAVFLVAAVVVGRLAALGRRRAEQAESRAQLAAAREREAALLAEVASAILGGDSVEVQLRTIGARIASATGAHRARIGLAPVPSPQPEEHAYLLGARGQNAWLYVSHGGEWDENDLKRIAEPLGRLIDVAVERHRVGEQAAETEAARRADVARKAVLHAISHDLRSPLTAITAAGAALRGGSLTAEEHAELLDLIEGQGARLSRLVDDLLDLSRIEAGAAAPQRDWCDLHDVVATALAALDAVHPIEFALPVDLPLVHADAVQLERVFSNLIENAVKFSPPDQPVRVTGGFGGGRVTVRVIDHGRGIPPQHRARVFEPFFRVRGDKPGSGLGLAIARGFVEANDGQLNLQSGSGRGTAFSVSFPLVRQPATV